MAIDEILKESEFKEKLLEFMNTIDSYLLDINCSYLKKEIKKNTLRIKLKFKLPKKTQLDCYYNNLRHSLVKSQIPINSFEYHEFLSYMHFVGYANDLGEYWIGIHDDRTVAVQVKQNNFRTVPENNTNRIPAFFKAIKESISCYDETGEKLRQ